MDITYLYDESGDAVAWLSEDRTVWSPSNRFIGSLSVSHEPTFVIDVDGRYVGEVIGDRLCRKRDKPYVSDTGRRSEPLRPHVQWGTPPMGSRSMLPYGYEDVPRSLLG